MGQVEEKTLIPIDDQEMIIEQLEQGEYDIYSDNCFIPLFYITTRTYQFAFHKNVRVPRKIWVYDKLNRSLMAKISGGWVKVFDKKKDQYNPNLSKDLYNAVRRVIDKSIQDPIDGAFDKAIKRVKILRGKII